MQMIILSLKICIKNISGKKVSFKIYEGKKYNYPDFTTFQPYVYDIMGRNAELTVPYRLKGKKNR